MTQDRFTDIYLTNHHPHNLQFKESHGSLTRPQGLMHKILEIHVSNRGRRQQQEQQQRQLESKLEGPALVPPIFIDLQYICIAYVQLRDGSVSRPPLFFLGRPTLQQEQA